MVATLAEDGRPPAHLGVTHWSARLLAAELKISFATVARIWRKWDLQPWRSETFKFSTDPELDAKIRDVVGLYVDPPEKAVVVCIDEKSQIQALDRTAPTLPIRPGLPERADPRLRPPWHHHPVRRARRGHRPGLSRPASRGTATRSSCASSSRSPRPTRDRSCTWSATTTPPTSTRPSRHGWHATPGSPCTSPRPRASWLNQVVRHEVA